MPGTIIKTKYSDITNQPAPDALAHSEQAYSFASNRLFIGKTSGATVDPIIIGGKYYTDMMNQTRGVLTADSAILVDQYKWVDHLITGGLKLTTSNGAGQELTSVVTTIGASPANSELPTALAVKSYTDSVAAAQTLTSLADVIISSVVNAQVLIYDSTAQQWLNQSLSGDLTISKTGVVTLANTGVTAQTYGSTTAIPVLTIDSKGRVTSASTASLATSLSIAGDTGTDSVALLTDTLTFVGGAGITSAVTNNTVTLDVDNTVARNTDKLNYFTATSSSELAQVISDETGTGKVVFSTSPTFTTEVVTDSLSFNVFNTNATTVQAFGAATDLALGATSGNTTVRNNLIVSGTLTVNGNTSTVNSTVTTLTDPVIMLAQDALAAGDSNDRGVKFNYGDGSQVQTGFFGMDMQTGRFVFKATGATATNPENFSTPWSDAQFGEIYGTGGTLGNVTVGVATDNKITTTSGTLVIDAANNTVQIDADASVTGTFGVTGTVTLTTALGVSSGGTGVSSYTGKAVFVSNSAGTATNFLTGSQYQIVQFDATGTPVASATIDGGTF
jgi:hypothetical protein